MSSTTVCYIIAIIIFALIALGFGWGMTGEEDISPYKDTYHREDKHDANS